MVHDLLLSKKGIAAPTSHALRLAVERHKARLNAELTKARLRIGLPSVEALRKHVEEEHQKGGVAADETPDAEFDSAKVSGLKPWPHPRWVRINTLKSSLEEQLSTTFTEYRIVDALLEILTAAGSNRVLHIDLHIPDLIALPPATDLTTTPAYKQGLIILQDKASCFPAYLLDPQPEDGDLIDACAAPGNKTTHLAALTCRHGSRIRSSIYACERDLTRAATLERMVSTAGAEGVVTIKGGQDTLQLDPRREPWCNIGALLLDPSCSGSGIIGREKSHSVILPKMKSSTTGRKRKYSHITISNDKQDTTPAEEALIDVENPGVFQVRLKALSSFQSKLLVHAFSFPSARKVTYSTCSVHVEENEEVVLRALESPAAKERGWKILKREQQVLGMRNWEVRGDASACRGYEDVAEGCLRCENGTEAGTQGFFVAAFVVDEGRNAPIDDDEWNGFD